MRARRNFEHSRGFTAVELVMAVGVFAIGVTGVFALQTVTAHTNHYAKELAVASYVAESWQERLAIDALQWTQTAGLGSTTWLSSAAPVGASTWFQPAATAGADFGPSFDELGAYTAIVPTDMVFCANIRLTQLFTLDGSGLIRTEVRVFWPKHTRLGWEDGAAFGYNYCLADNTAADAITASSKDFYLVYKTSVVRQTAGF